MFFKGALLKDDHHVLVQQTKNVQAARQIRFSDASDVVKLDRVVKAYIREARIRTCMEQILDGKGLDD